MQKSKLINQKKPDCVITTEPGHLFAIKKIFFSFNLHKYRYHNVCQLHEKNNISQTIKTYIRNRRYFKQVFECKVTTKKPNNRHKKR